MGFRRPGYYTSADALVPIAHLLLDARALGEDEWCWSDEGERVRVTVPLPRSDADEAGAEPAAVEAAVEQTVSDLGRLDILVNGAAGNFLCLAEQLSPNGFGTVVDIDLKGTFHCSKAALPHLKRHRGTVLNISATLHYVGTPAQLHVSSAKAGVDALTRVLAVEWGPYGIRVNGIAPGPIADTEGVRRLLDEAATRRATEATPLRRLGLIDDVAAASLFLCSEAASYVTGHTLVVDGGLWLSAGRSPFAEPPGQEQ